MKKSFLSLIVGLLLMITGIFLLDLNFFLAIIVLGVGVIALSRSQIYMWSAQHKNLKAAQQKNLQNKMAKIQKEKKIEKSDSKPDTDPKTAALLNAIRERSKEDPLIGAKIASKEVYQRMLDALKDSRGVHVESLLTALGALAGYACQATLRTQAVLKGLPEISPFTLIETNDGGKYYFGEHLNNLLLSNQYSVWSIVAGAAQNAGANQFPDINEIAQHTASVVGSDQFGIPRVPDDHRAGCKPVEYLNMFWYPLFSVVKLLSPNPVHWPIVYSLAIQEAINLGKAHVEPSLAFRIVMESAIPMSKIDLVSF